MTLKQQLTRNICYIQQKWGELDRKKPSLQVFVLIGCIGMCIMILFWGDYPLSGANSFRSSSPGDIVATFDGTNITVDDIQKTELSRVQSLIKNHRYTGSIQMEHQVANFAIDSLLDKIELQQLTKAKQRTTYKLTDEQAMQAIFDEHTFVRSFSSQEMEDFYQAHQNLFARSGPALHLQEIVVSDMSTATHLREKLLSGASFSLTAQRFSLDPPFYRNIGGDLGWMNIDQMPPGVEEVAFSLPPKTVSLPFAVGKYYVIIQVLEGPRYDVIPYQDVAPSLQGYMVQYKQQQMFLTWMSLQIIHTPLVIHDARYTQAFQDARKDLAKQPDQSDNGTM